MRRPCLAVTALLTGAVVLPACSNDIKVTDTPNQPPIASIDAPADGAAFVENEVIEFVGVVSDADGLSDIQALTWVSDRDGEIADFALAQPDAQGVSRANGILSVGVHAVTLRVTDAGGTVGEDTISVAVGVGDTMPVATIVEPLNFTTVFPGVPVDLLGQATDPNDASETLLATWSIKDPPPGTAVHWTSTTVSPDATGLLSDTWTPTATGNYMVELDVSDPQGNHDVETVFVVVDDPNDADLDGDGFSPNGGDCDDGNAAINPGADEICGNALDDDCTADPTMVPPFDGVDDKDLDGDDHIDEACVNYTYGDRPVDDCDDNDNQTFPGAYEAQDGLDNDCDGSIDNGGQNYDDDGDCFCESGPCVGSSNPACLTVTTGDCDDANAAVNPGAIDVPELTYTDGDCDGIDGKSSDSIFLDPIGGNNAADGLTTATAVRDLDTAYQKANTNGRAWILISSGSVGLVGDFRQGFHLAGGYEAGSGWSRSALSTPTIDVPSGGKWLRNWTNPTEWQQLDISAASTGAAGASSVALWLDNVDLLSMLACVVSADNAGGGTAGTTPATTGTGSAGSPGGNGCEEGGCCGDWVCLCSCCNRPAAPGGGAGCGGGNGGSGGRPGIDGGTGDTGVTGSSVGGASGGGGGAGGNNNGDQGSSGLAGAQGDSGGNGSAGAPIGTFDGGGYTPATGGGGGTGAGGAGGGGGGGGAGGGWTNGNCDTWGGAGGGGGGGGCGGNGGTGGTGGGASVGVVLINGSALVVEGGRIYTGNGGNGGSGGNGGTGGAGGAGGAGGDGETSIISEQSGPGGQGGQGGRGGTGGHGGGGGGGPSIGIVCRGGSTLSTPGAAPSYTLGNGGVGGTSLGASGSNGTRVNTDGC